MTSTRAHRRDNATALYNSLMPHERAAAAKGGRRSRSHGLSRAEIGVVLARQGGKCAVCEGELTLAKACGDHDHESGAFRAVLCDGCNRAIGFIKENPAALRRAADYLEYHAARRENER